MGSIIQSVGTRRWTSQAPSNSRQKQCKWCRAPPLFLDGSRTMFFDAQGEVMVESERQEIQARLAAEQLRGLVDFARDVLKLVTLINGGAAIALLAFAGVVRSTQSSDSSLDGSLIICAIGVFTVGVLLSSIGVVTGYITQLKYFQEASGNVPVGGSKCWHTAALIFVVLSILFFFAGVILSIVAFSF